MVEPMANNTALLVVDVQRGLDDPSYGERNNPGAEATISRLLAAWRRAGRPIIHVQHHSTRPSSALHPDKPGVEFKDAARPEPGEPVIRKQVNAAFIGTDLEARLRADGIDTLVVAGLTTNHCVSSTARMAGDLGFRTFVVADATAAHGQLGPGGRRFSAAELHDAALASLQGEFATVLNADDILARLDPPTDDRRETQ